MVFVTPLAFVLILLVADLLPAAGAEAENEKAAVEDEKKKPAAEPVIEKKVADAAKKADGDATKTQKAEKKDDKKSNEKKASAEAEKKPSEGEKSEKKDSKDGEEKDGDAKDAAAKDREKPAEEKKAPEPPVFRLRDGSRISGFPTIKQITIDTAYGKLVVPSQDIVRIRFVREVDSELEEKIRGEVSKLGDEEFERREEATASLTDLGEPALKFLRDALKFEDEEVKSRAESIIKKIEESLEDQEVDEDENGVPISGDEDEVVTLKFTAKGKIHERSFQVTSTYGKLSIDRKDIISVVFQEHTPSEVTLSVPGTYFAAADNWYQTKIKLKEGEDLSISASGQLALQNYSHNTGPEGSTQTSTKHFEKHRLGALVARIGKNKAFFVGKKFVGKANADGKLMFGIAMRSGRVSGAYNVKVQLSEDRSP